MARRERGLAVSDDPVDMLVALEAAGNHFAKRPDDRVPPEVLAVARDRLRRKVMWARDPENAAEAELVARLLAVRAQRRLVRRYM